MNGTFKVSSTIPIINLDLCSSKILKKIKSLSRNMECNSNFGISTSFEINSIKSFMECFTKSENNIQGRLSLTKLNNFFYSNFSNHNQIKTRNIFIFTDHISVSIGGNGIFGINVKIMDDCDNVKEMINVINSSQILSQKTFFVYDTKESICQQPEQFVCKTMSIESENRTITLVVSSPNNINLNGIINISIVY